MNKTIDDNELLKLITDNKGIIFKICNAYCDNKADREDLAQEIIYHLWKSAKGYNREYRFSTWMYRVALNVAISFYRKEKKGKPILSISEHVMEMTDANGGPIEKDENIKLLFQLVHELNPLDRALILLWFEQKTYKEIAAVIDISESNVATRLSRVKEKLKQQFFQINKK